MFASFGNTNVFSFTVFLARFLFSLAEIDVLDAFFALFAAFWF